MIPRKLVETAFRNKIALLAPIVLVPLLVLLFTSSPRPYQSVATVWVTEPPDQQAVLGHSDPWRTPAQNQAVAINDLLATRAFRAAVFQRAGLLSTTANDPTRLDPSLRLWAASTGVNLVKVGALSGSAETSQKLVGAVIEEYMARAVAEGERGINANAEFFRRQLESAQRELDERRAKLNEYIAAHPELTDIRLAATNIDYQALRTDVDAQTTIVQNLSDQLQGTELRLAAGSTGQAAAFSVQDPPSRPRAPLKQSMTKRFGLPLAGAMFGGLIAGAFLLVRYRSDHTIVSIEDLAGVEVPTLGFVPELTPPGLLGHVPIVSSLIRLRSSGYARTTARSIGATLSEEPQ
ncbi:MAG: hypothetical protein M0R74_15665 [Dehalococcoidia bacterium]|nr:hypothetical protein [Dehalococcoidia bacterium]